MDSSQIIRNWSSHQPPIVKITRRQFLGLSAGSMALGVLLPGKFASAQGQSPAKPGTNTWAFIEIRLDSSVLLHSAFVDGGQGINTAMAQLVGEELDVDPTRFTVHCAQPDPQFLIMNGRRFTGGSFSVRSSYDTMRRLGASARLLLMQAASKQLSVPVAALNTAAGKVVDPASGRSLTYGDLVAAASKLPLPEKVELRAEKSFRWIGKPVPRLDLLDKSTGKAQYAIDLSVPDMMLAAVVHAPRLGGEPTAIKNELSVLASPGVHSVHKLPGAVAVVADRWWRARKAVESLEIEWTYGSSQSGPAMPSDFSSDKMLETLKLARGPGVIAENVGDTDKAMAAAAQVVEGSFHVPFLAHGQLEPPSSIARFNADGKLELWVPNQMPDLFQSTAAKIAGVTPDQVILHSPILGGFFGRHFLYPSAHPFSQAILLAKVVKRPVKVIWSREQEFLRDALRPMALARMKAGLDQKGMPVALQIEAVGEGPIGRAFGRKPEAADPSAVEGMVRKPYAIANRRVSQVPVSLPAVIGFWRSVGHSMNDYFYEAFLDQIAAAAGQDPYDYRLKLLQDSPRQKHLVETVADLSGGWKGGVFKAADGSSRARGIALISAFATEVATIAEVSVAASGQVVVHDIWVAIDPGRIVNPSTVEDQVRSAVALGLSETLVEAYVYQNGEPVARNFGAYSILRPTQMPRVHVRIVESGAQPMGGVGEPGLPGVAPAVANAIATLTGQRVHSLPVAGRTFQSLPG